MYGPCFGKIGMTMQGLKLPPDQGKLERILTSLQASKDSGDAKNSDQIGLFMNVTKWIDPSQKWR